MTAPAGPRTGGSRGWPARWPFRRTVRISHTSHQQGGTEQIYLRADRQLGTQSLSPARRCSRPTEPFFSPGRPMAGFLHQRGKLKKVSVSGGPPITICEYSGLPPGLAWGTPGRYHFWHDYFGLLRKFPIAGAPRSRLGLGRRDGQFWPEFLPGGNAVLFTA